VTEQREHPAPAGLLLSDDLIFTSRIRGTARASGQEILQARSVEVLLELAGQQPPRAVLIDLGHPGLALEELLRRLREVCPMMPRVIAYGSHVDTASLKAARAAGCDVVLPRSKFVEDLEKELPKWLADG
jgi:DNA-binding NarL/FixJ family response regulator